MGDPVQLTDLDVITRYSIAVRSATADRDELLQALRSDLSWLERGRPRTTSYTRAADVDDTDDELVEDEPAPRTPLRRMAIPRTPARKTAASSTAAKKTAARKTAAKKATPRKTR